MHARGLLASLLTTAFLLAGCTSSGGGGDDGDDPALEDLGLKATETTGVIRGVVVDEAIVPLAGVSINVQTQGVNRTAESNEAGLFGLDGLPGGEYFVVASKEGYNPVQTTVTVVVGDDDPPTTKIMLTVDPALLPFFDAYQYDAFIGCSITTPTVSAAACDILGPVKELTNNEFLVSYDAARPPGWIQSEAIWDSSSPPGDDLSLSLTDFSDGPQRTVAATAGKSPIHFTVNETRAAQFNYGINNSLVIRVFSTTVQGTDNVDETTFQGPYKSTAYPVLNGTGAPKAYEDHVIGNDFTGLLNNPFSNPECIEDAVLFNTCFDLGGVGIVVNQRVNVFTHIFYGYAPPEGWLFSEASMVPQPPSK